MSDALGVRAVTAGDFDAVAPLLETFPGSKRPREHWRRMLFDPPWDTGGPERGFALFDGARAVGFLGTLYSVRPVDGAPHRFCNLSSWVVEDAYRSSSMQLVFPLLAMKDVTFVNLTPSPAAHRIFAGLGFRTLEDHQVLEVPLTAGTLFGDARVITSLEAMREALPPGARAAVDAVAATPAVQIVLRAEGLTTHVVAVPTPWKWGARLARIVHAGDWALAWRHRARISRALGPRAGTVGLRIDGRFAGAPGLLSKRAPLHPTTLYRPGHPGVTPRTIDGLYTELLWPDR